MKMRFILLTGGDAIYHIAKLRILMPSLQPALFGVLLLFCSVGTVADVDQPTVSNDSVNVAVNSVQLGPSLRVIKDPDGTMTADRLLMHPTPEGVRGQIMTSFTFTDAAYWFVVPLDNPGKETLKRLLVLEPTWLDDVRVSLAEPDGTLRKYRGGDWLDFAQRSLPHQKINFELSLPPGRSRLLVRVQTQDPFVVGMTLWERSSFYRADGKERMYLGLVYGVLGAMLLYNLMLFVAVREKVYAAYVAYVFFFILMHATYNGLMFHHFWPHSPAWGNWAHSLVIYLFISAGLFFAINFLELHSRLLAIYRWARSMFWVCSASFIITAILGGYGLNITNTIIWVIIFSLYSLFLGTYSLIAGNRSARYFLPATAAGFLGSGITALSVSGLIPLHFFTYRAADIGMMIDAILLSIALADRLKIARSETEHARAELLASSRFHAQKLEEEVHQRTLELQEANATKDKFFSIIAHDLRGPIGGLALLYTDIVHSGKDFTDEILMLTRLTTSNTSNLLEQLLTWARSQRGEIDYNPEPIELGELLREMQELFSAQASAKGIQLGLNVEGKCWGYADRPMVQTVLRNLINNALKYTQHGGSITVSLSNKNECYLFRITDTGIGMDQALQKTLFRLGEKPQSLPGTQGEEGTGLGLILCSEFVHKNGGTIGAQSETGLGSTFWFTLPKANVHESHESRVAVENQRTLNILVADDTQINLETSGKMLRDLGHAVSFAHDGAEAVQLAGEKNFDFILMDIDMPNMNGIEAARHIRRTSGNSQIVAWSSYSRKELSSLTNDFQFDGYLDKTLNRDALISALIRK